MPKRQGYIQKRMKYHKVAAWPEIALGHITKVTTEVVGRFVREPILSVTVVNKKFLTDTCPVALFCRRNWIQNRSFICPLPWRTLILHKRTRRQWPIRWTYELSWKIVCIAIDPSGNYNRTCFLCLTIASRLMRTEASSMTRQPR
jgi:hypothetical protein